MKRCWKPRWQRKAAKEEESNCGGGARVDPCEGSEGPADVSLPSSPPATVPIYGEEEEEEEEEDHLSAGLVKVERFNVACCLASWEEEDLNRCARAFDLKTRIQRRCSEDELNRRQLLKVQAGRDDAAEVCRALLVAAGASGPQRLSAPADAAPRRRLDGPSSRIVRKRVPRGPCGFL